jgi:aminoglycoside phosphotransferase (APT) family kinase protein
MDDAASNNREAAVLRRFHPNVGHPIGHGGEARVYELAPGRVLRIFHRDSPPHLEALRSFYDRLRRDVPFALPEILEAGEIDGVAYCVDRRIPGDTMIDILPDLRGPDRRRVLDSYTDAAHEMAGLIPPGESFGELFEAEPLRGHSWREYLHASIDRQIAHMGAELEADVRRFAGAIAVLHKRIDALDEPQAQLLVHGDYFPGNVLVDADLRVSGVIDFGPLTVMGDPLMDLCSAAVFLEVQRRFDPGDAEYVMRRLVERHGAAVEDASITYRAWYAVRLGHAKEDDERLYAWCVRALESLI